ncbi:MAG: acyltransferase [Hymenobacter sp.]|nr:MAG: acyltransferase [Hymenobacter sp.]
MSEHKSIPLVQRDFTLDSLRGIAAVMVVLFHYTMFTGKPTYGLHVGITGVDLFFIISGFVIFMTLNRTRVARDFVISRFIRLYPTYWVCVTFTFLVNAIYATTHHNLTLSYVVRYLGNMTMFQRYLRLQDLDDPYWTMIVEMVFYLSMLVIYITGQLRRIEWVGGILCLFTFLISTLGPVYLPRVYYGINFLFPLINHFPLFFAGILFYLIKQDRPTVARYAMIGGCFGASLFVFNNLGRFTFLTYAEDIGMRLLYFIIFTLYVNDKLDWLANKVLVYLGSISYALYLIHQNISLVYLRPLLTRLFGDHFWLNNLLMLVIVMALASAVTYWVEQPAIQFLKARLQVRKKFVQPEKIGIEAIKEVE